MTNKREPFAIPKEEDDSFGWAVWVDGQMTGRDLDADVARELSDHVNAAFEARVKEEVKKAVEDNEEFKAKLIESMICPEDADPVWAHGFKVAQVAIAKVIRAKNLPRELREPEGKP